MWSLVSEYLLVKSDSLEIKNFGKFTATNYDATIDPESNIIKPAGRKFAFIPVGTKTDEEFIEYGTKRLKKSRPEIERMLEKALIQAHAKLNNGEKVELPHIGYIFAPDKQNPTLVQTAQYSLNPDNFGYTEISLPGAGRTIPKSQQKTKVEHQKTQKANKNEATKKATKAKKQPKPKKNKKKVAVNWTQIFKYAAMITAIIAVIAVIIAFYQPIANYGKTLFSPKKQKLTTQIEKKQNPTITKTATPQQPKQTQQATAATSQKKQATSTPEQTPTQAQTNTKPTPTSDTTLLNPIKIKAHIALGPGYKKYYLIVGSFVKKENAENFKQQLRKEGFPALVLSFGPQRHRVSIGGHNDPQQVIKAYKQYTTKHPGKGIWLLINNQVQ